MHITKHLLIVLCSSALLTSGLTAQRTESTDREREATPTPAQREAAGREAQQTRESAAREGQQTRESAAREGQKTREQAAAGRGEAARGAAGHPTAAQQRALAAEIAHQETTHRARMGKLKRLKQLAEKSRQAARAKEVDILEGKEMAAHKRKMAMLSSRLDPQARAAMERTVDRGRESKARTPADRRKALDGWKKSHPGRSLGVERRGNAAGQGGRETRGNTDRATGGQQRENKTREGNGGRDG